MLLYHFAEPANRTAILERGLLPVVEPKRMSGDVAVVWLTSEPTTVLSAADRAEFKKQGDSGTRWILDRPLRVTVRIGSHDNKLARYADWLRRTPLWEGKPASLPFEAMQAWWIYRGVIVPAKIVECVDVAD